MSPPGRRDAAKCLLEVVESDADRTFAELVGGDGGEKLVECRGRPGLGVVQKVGIGVQGDLGAGVPEALLDDRGEDSESRTTRP